MKQRDIKLYVDLVQRIAEQSRARRLKVGALLVTIDDVLIMGYNGTPAGWDNNCEDEVVEVVKETSYGDVLERVLRTRDEVVHAEMNVYRKAANSQNSIKGGTLFLTHPPCQHCAKLYLSTGLKEVIYVNDYISSSSNTNLGLELLQRDGIKVTKWNENAEV